MSQSAPQAAHSPGNVAQWADFIRLLSEAAEKAARPASPAIDGDTTTEAARATPLWNVLADAVDKALKQPGARARVARYIGVPRQRITDYTKGRRMPDAEITLRLLHWLAASRAGNDPSYTTPSAEPAFASSTPRG